MIYKSLAFMNLAIALVATIIHVMAFLKLVVATNLAQQ